MWCKANHFLLVSIILGATSLTFGQISEQTEKYRNDAYGDIQNRRESTTSGNLVRTLFYNNGEIGQWPFSPSGEWPAGSGHNYIDGTSALIAAEIQTDVGIVHPLQTSYREWMDSDPVNGTIWGFEPVAGYSNPQSDKIALSTEPDSWPDRWPDALNIDDSWDGFWYGYFGKGVMNSDFESFFVMDDSKDGEWSRPPYNFFPVSTDHDRGGLGLRVEVRNFAWSDKMAEDISFWHYDVFNLSDYTYNKTVTGFYIDAGVGGTSDAGDDMASYDPTQDIVYCFDHDGFGAPGNWKTGYLGYAYLETPGNSFDGVDNDEDGLVDERRDNEAGPWIFGPVGIYGDPKEHFQGDEDGDWLASEDDVGTDGLGPLDDAYTGPDSDGTEGNGIPDQGEPNFGITDKDESDQIGLTSVSIYRLGDGGTGGGWPKDDEPMWLRMQPNKFDTSLQNANISMVFASGAFPLKLNGRDRFSMALLFGDDLDDLLLNKIVAQNIYNNNYEFDEITQLIPVQLDYPLSSDTVNGSIEVKWNTANYSNTAAVADIYISEDGDNFEFVGEELANKGTYSLNTENFVDGIFYKLKIVCNDGVLYGEAVTQTRFIINNSGNGLPQVKFYLPEENQKLTGEVDIIFVGGDPDGDPSTISLYYGTSANFETANLIVENLSDRDTSYLWNTFDVANRSQYFLFAKIQNELNAEISMSKAFSIENERNLTKGELLTISKTSRGTGDFYFASINPNEIVAHKYRIDFIVLSDSTDIGYSLFDISDSTYWFENERIGLDNESPFFNGGRLSIFNDTRESVIDSLSYWEIGNSNLTMNITPDKRAPSRNMIWEEDFVLTFGSNNVYTTPFFRIPSNIQITLAETNSIVDYEIFDNDESGDLSLGDDLVILKDLASNYKLTWNIKFLSPHDPGLTPIFPYPGCVFRFSTTKKFKAGEQILFRTDLLVDLNESTNIINNYSLEQNYPNPFNLTTKINYTISQTSCVTLKVFDMLGKEITTLVSGEKPVGKYEIEFDGSYLSSGIYFYRMQAGSFTDTKKFILLK